WVASSSLASLYTTRFGFDSRRVKATGYARTDRIVSNGVCGKAIRSQLGLPEKKIVLFAPTWRQDARGRSIYPFGLSANEFIAAVAPVADANNAVIVLRTHLNSDT